MFKNKTFDITVKVVLTLLAVASAGVIFFTDWNGRSEAISIVYGILFLLAAIAFWFSDKNRIIKIILDCLLVINLIVTISQTMSDMPLGMIDGGPVAASLLAVLFAAPSVLGLIYFNLSSFQDGWDVILVLLRIVLSFVVGYTSLILVLMLAVSGTMIWLMPQWAQIVFVYGILLLAFLDIVYAIINWLKFYRGKLTWITTSLFVIQIVGTLPLFGPINFEKVLWTLFIVVVVIATAYMNNRVKERKSKK